MSAPSQPTVVLEPVSTTSRDTVPDSAATPSAATAESAKGKKKRVVMLKWTAAAERSLVDAYTFIARDPHHTLGSVKSLTKTGWTLLAERFNKEYGRYLGLECTNKQVKNKWKKLKEKFGKLEWCRSMENRSGMGARKENEGWWAFFTRMKTEANLDFGDKALTAAKEADSLDNIVVEELDKLLSKKLATGEFMASTESTTPVKKGRKRRHASGSGGDDDDDDDDDDENGDDDDGGDDEEDEDGDGDGDGDDDEDEDEDEEGKGRATETPAKKGKKRAKTSARELTRVDFEHLGVSAPSRMNTGKEPKPPTHKQTAQQALTLGRELLKLAEADKERALQREDERDKLMIELVDRQHKLVESQISALNATLARLVDKL